VVFTPESRGEYFAGWTWDTNGGHTGEALSLTSSRQLDSASGVLSQEDSWDRPAVRRVGLALRDQDCNLPLGGGAQRAFFRHPQAVLRHPG